MLEMINFVEQHNYWHYITKNCQPRKKLSADRFFTRNKLILLDSVDECETFYACTIN
jgi:hypothetical protein